MAFPGKANLIAYQGDSWAQTFRFLDEGVPVDLTGATAQAWARSTTGEVHDLVVTIGPGAGEVTIAWPALGPLPRDIYDYDVEVTDSSGGIRTWVYGRLRVQRDITNELVAP